MIYYADFNIGDRVEIDPGCDRWMMGDKYGTVELMGKRYIQVRLDKSRKLSAWFIDQPEKLRKL